MLIEVKDLKVGDEIIVSANSYLSYLRVLRPVELRWKKNVSGVKEPIYVTFGPHIGEPFYKAVKCSERVIITFTPNQWDIPNPFKSKVHICSPEDHNYEAYRDLNFRGIWLVKRKI